MIDKVSRKHGGTYECLARNGAGTSTAATKATLVVKGKSLLCMELMRLEVIHFIQIQFYSCFPLFVIYYMISYNRAIQIDVHSAHILEPEVRNWYSSTPL